MTLKELVLKFKKELDYCTFCPKMCRFSCPVANSEYKETVTPWGKMWLLRQCEFFNKQEDMNNLKSTYHCLSCLLCREYCKHDFDIPSAMYYGRSKAVKDNMFYGNIIPLLDNMDKYGNPFKINLKRKIESLVSPFYLQPGSSAIYFPGCSAIAEEHDIILSTLLLFEKMDIDYVAVHNNDTMCCGVNYLYAGFPEKFNKHAEKLRTSLSGYKLIVSSCPTCVYVLKSLYHDIGLGFKADIVHTTNLLHKHINNISFIKDEKLKVTYHDPCYLGRYLHEYNIPRQLLKKVVGSIDELPENKQFSECCGAGGGMKWILPEVADKVTKTKSEALDEINCQDLVTACPSCRSALSNSKTTVKDIVEILLEGC